MKKGLRLINITSFIFIIICAVCILVSCDIIDETFKVTFDLDGGETYEKVEYTCKQGEVLTLFKPTKDGYLFVGWQFNEEIITEDTITVTSNMHLIAIWEALTYHITLNMNIEGLENEVIEVKANETFFLPTPEKTGYNFAGWYLNDILFTDTIYLENRDITLDAKWEKEIYLITLMDEDETIIEIGYNDEISLPVLKKDGYKFMGWYEGNNLFTDKIWKRTENIYLTPKWEKEIYLITLIDEDKTIIEIGYNDEINLPVLEKDGYKFMGWYEEDTKFEERIWKRLDNVTLYAKWEKDTSQELTLINSFDILYYDMQTSEYDQISIFKSTSSISASRYWHKIGIVKIDGKYYVSGIAESGSNLSSLPYYEYIILAYTSYSRYKEFVGMDLQIGDLVKFDHDLSDLSKGSVKLNVSFYHESHELPPLDELKAFFDSRYQGITEVNESINLVDSYKGIPITWTTSNQDVITKSGEYNKPYVTREVELKAFIDDQEVYKFSFIVKGKTDESHALATGYFYTNFNLITENTIKNLDIIYCAFAYVNPNGDFTNTSATSNFIKNIQKYVLPLAKKYGTKVLISVNEENGAFGPIAMSEELSKKLASNIVTLINTLELDGIDIDWEYPTVEETPYFTTMMKAIYDAVKNNNPSHLVTAAIAGGKWQPPRYDLVNSAKYLDYINLMTYSMTSSNGQFQNSLYKSSKGYTLTSCTIDESVAIYEGYGVARSKLLVGLAFYGIKQSGSNGLGTASTSSASISFSLIYQNYLMNPNPNIIIGFDEESVSPYIYDSINKVLISYENERSIARKCEYVNTHGLGGVMYWQDGHDYQDILLNAVCENIRK